MGDFDCLASGVHCVHYGKNSPESMVVRCNWCFAVLDKPGALLFSPPDRVGQCAKIHVCVACYKRVLNSGAPTG
jgi:hypothetical protein